MAYQSLDPIDLSTAAVGDSYTALPSGQYEGVSQVLLTNNSGFAFAISASSMGELPPLSAYSSAAYNAPPNGGALTATISGGQPGNQPPVQLGIMLAFGTSNFGGVSQAVGSVNIGSEVNITGNVTVDSITGTVDANITNANLPVSGSVDANITNATLTVDGTVSLTAGQVVEVTNQAGGSLTVAGTVAVNDIAGTVTVDANGSTINIDELLNTITVGHQATATSTLTFTAQQGTTNLLVVLPFPLGGSNTTVVPTVTTSGSGIVGVPRPVLATSAITVWEIATINPGTVTVTIPSAATWNVAEVVGRLPWAAVGTITYVVPNPAGGFEWSFTLPYAAQLTRLSAKFLAGSTTANRWLYLVTSQSASYGGYIPLSSAATTANAQVLVGAATGPPAVPVTEAGLGITLARLPSGALPAGLVVSSYVEGFQAADQWSSIQVDLVDP